MNLGHHCGLKIHPVGLLRVRMALGWAKVVEVQLPSYSESSALQKIWELNSECFLSLTQVDLSQVLSACVLKAAFRAI